MKEDGWKVDFIDNNIVAEKKVQDYVIEMKTFGKKQKKDIEDDQFKEVNVYVKNHKSKWLKAEWIVLEKAFHLNRIGFLRGKQSNSRYCPKLESLPNNLQNEVTNFFFKLGVNEKTLTSMSEISTYHENKMYIEWLKKLKETV